MELELNKYNRLYKLYKEEKFSKSEFEYLTKLFYLPFSVNLTESILTINYGSNLIDTKNMSLSVLSLCKREDDIYLVKIFSEKNNKVNGHEIFNKYFSIESYELKEFLENYIKNLNINFLIFNHEVGEIKKFSKNISILKGVVINPIIKKEYIIIPIELFEIVINKIRSDNKIFYTIKFIKIRNGINLYEDIRQIAYSCEDLYSWLEYFQKRYI